MQKLASILVLVVILRGVHQEIVQQMVQLIRKYFIFDEKILSKLQIDAHDIVQDFDGHDGNAQQCLRHHLGRLVAGRALAAQCLVEDAAALEGTTRLMTRLELLRVRQE